MTQIKVTGIVRPEDANLAADMGVDIVSCVLHPASPRYVATEDVWRIRRALRGRARFVGVFVDTPAPLVQRLMDHCQFDMAQLFGSEPRSAIDGLRPAAFKAVSVGVEDDIEHAAKAFAVRRAASDQPALLLNLVDGLSRQWAAIAPLARRLPVILAAAGLDADTASEAVSASRPWAVDVWDAVESAPGQLDPTRLEAFVAAVRGADAALAAAAP